jgi:pyridinium-3,5-biscarboxylic acid mononucleotide synthase
MRPDDLRHLLEKVSRGETTISEAMRSLETLPFQELGFATIDHHRSLRTGFPEVVYGASKTVEQVARIVEVIAERKETVLVTRIDPEKAERAVLMLGPSVRHLATVERVPRLLVVGEPMPVRGRGKIAVVSAGTGDEPVAEEAARTAEIFGNEVVRVRDVGVAGLHRLLAHRATLEAAEIVIVVAGMEGALPSVVSGLISRPVIGVPTSIGFGANFGGVSALLSMLNACAAGLTVVNIDNGFGAGYAAALMNAPRRT